MQGICISFSPLSIQQWNARLCFFSILRIIIIGYINHHCKRVEPAAYDSSSHTSSNSIALGSRIPHILVNPKNCLCALEFSTYRNRFVFTPNSVLTITESNLSKLILNDLMMIVIFFVFNVRSIMLFFAPFSHSFVSVWRRMNSIKHAILLYVCWCKTYICHANAWIYLRFGFLCRLGQFLARLDVTDIRLVRWNKFSTAFYRLVCLRLRFYGGYDAQLSILSSMRSSSKTSGNDDKNKLFFEQVKDINLPTYLLQRL